MIQPLPAIDATTLVPAAVPAVPAPPAEDVGRFEAALSAPRVTITELGQEPPVIEPTVLTPATLGDRILASVEQIRVGYHEGMARIDSTMRRDDVRLPDMMRLFVDTIHMSLQQEMLAKMVGRSTQTLDQLIKGQ